MKKRIILILLSSILMINIVGCKSETNDTLNAVEKVDLDGNVSESDTKTNQEESSKELNYIILEEDNNNYSIKKYELPTKLYEDIGYINDTQELVYNVYTKVVYTLTYERNDNENSTFSTDSLGIDYEPFINKYGRHYYYDSKSGLIKLQH